MTQPVDIWTPNPAHVADKAAEQGRAKDERDTATALEVLKVAAGRAPTGATTQELAAFAEVLWQWVTTDSWPPQGQ